MSSIILKSKFLLALLLLITFFIYGCGEKDRELEGKTEIFEIANTEEIYNYPDSETVTIRKHYMIISPPKDLDELKILVERFYKDNPIDKKVLVEENKKRYIEILFYRESKRLPRNWQPNEAYFDTDRIEHHKADLIAVIYWSDYPPHNIYYSILSRSSDKDDYGLIIEDIEYIDEDIVE